MKTYAEKKWGDCSNAVAYELNFVQLCYGYESDAWTDFHVSKCPHIEDLSIQFRDYEYPKGGFSKKDYYQLGTWHMGVSERLRKDMLAFGVEAENFRPVYTRKHDVILGWQITPIHIMKPIWQVNGMEEIVRCELCNYKIYECREEIRFFDAYDGFGYPTYITQEVLDELQSINGCYEDSLGVVISLELYNYLIEKYPRLECRPVFLGDIKDDKEYIRLIDI